MLCLDNLRERFLQGNMRALAQSISLVEDNPELGAKLFSLLGQPQGNPRIIGVTGPPGAGKSTLTAKLALALLARGERVALLLIDPSSPFSGGAILGDRIRMHELSGLSDVYIRSLSTRGSLGGLSAATARVLRLLQHGNFSTIILETVGTGQAETDVVMAVDAVVVVAVPGLGDDIQAMKAGIMEIADVFVVNKADRDGADRTKLQIEAMLGMQEGRRVHPIQVLPTIATTGYGVAELTQALDDHFAYVEQSGELARRREKRWHKEFSAYVANILLGDFFSWANRQDIGIMANAEWGEIEVYGLAKKATAQYFTERMKRHVEED
ncbi:MAG: methylmalonyl Co-A mutase-associated GTPase MeaB [Peptococcaceae bacterium]|nr:methylmalonyl Co-A mutase-associated GTPase MeaB [Peptococcaceae bacterium]